MINNDGRVVKPMYVEKLVIHVSDAASLLSCSSQVIYKLIANKEIDAYKAGRTWKIYYQSILDYIAARLKNKPSV